MALKRPQNYTPAQFNTIR